MGLVKEILCGKNESLSYAIFKPHNYLGYKVECEVLHRSISHEYISFVHMSTV